MKRFNTEGLKLGHILVILSVLAVFSILYPVFRDMHTLHTIVPAMNEDPSPGAAEDRADQSEGIEVHGHWVIEIYEEDGRLAGRQEFDNEFVGAEALVKFLARTYSVGKWSMELSSMGGTVGFCLDENGDPAPCYWMEPDVTVRATPANELELIATGIAERDGYFGDFLVYVKPCDPTIPPSDPCNATEEDRGLLFSSYGGRKFKQNPVENQRVVVSVTYSFTPPTP